MREYLYIPLGGNRVSPGRQYMNLWIVFLLSGFWHGAAWNFIAWGAFHGLFLTLDKLRQARGRRPWPAWLAIPVNFVLVMISWVFFRADTLGAAVRYLGRMFHPGSSLGGGGLTLKAFLPAHAAVVLAVAAVICFLPAFTGLRAKAVRPVPSGLGVALQGAAALLLLFLSTCALASGGFNPFIYFRF
jgi:alginate O-acetyltransferase complex protein AlgI